jgi:prolyl-tRNA editing enzyme YbaK/EbsC (Cys-tRNA(Pro) deacylase)
MSTRAIQFLKQKKILFEVVKYDHEEKGAAFASRASGFPLERTVKTLVVMEESILKFEEILINAGQRGTMLLMAPEDIEKAVIVKVACIAK